MLIYTNIHVLGAGGHEPSGINFDRYEDIPVEATGSDVPSPIEDVSIRKTGGKYGEVYSVICSKILIIKNFYFIVS